MNTQSAIVKIMFAKLPILSKRKMWNTVIPIVRILLRPLFDFENTILNSEKFYSIPVIVLFKSHGIEHSLTGKIFLECLEAFYSSTFCTPIFISILSPLCTNSHFPSVGLLSIHTILLYFMKNYLPGIEGRNNQNKGFRAPIVNIQLT